MWRHADVREKWLACSMVEVYRTYGVGKVNVKVVLKQAMKPRVEVGA